MEIIHQHNEALQAIDKRIKILIETSDYLSLNNKGQGGTTFSNQLNEIYEKLIKLKKSKDLLLSFNDSFESEMLRD